MLVVATKALAVFVQTYKFDPDPELRQVHPISDAFVNSVIKLLSLRETGSGEVRKEAKELFLMIQKDHVYKEQADLILSSDEISDVVVNTLMAASLGGIAATAARQRLN